MFAHDGTYIINVDIDPADLIFPMIPAGGTVDNIMLNSNKKFSL